MTASALTAAERTSLRQASARVRESILRIVHDAGSGHVGGALSQADILVALYHRVLRFDVARPDWPQRDRFILSKGHGGLGLAAVLADCGLLAPAALATFGDTGSALGMHMDHRQVASIETATGSLGHGLGIAVGMALGLRLRALPARVVCLLSDGECYEGSTWEAALSASGQRLDNLLAIVDRNRLTMDGFTEEELPLEPLARKWESFGWRALACDGHDHDALALALAQARDGAGPCVIVADTVKGKGVGFMENQARWHYGALDSQMLAAALASVRGEAQP